MSLVDDIRSGSSDAIKQLYQENAQDVYEFAKDITNNHDTAMQATKNTLSKLVQQIQNGDEPANLHSEALKLAYDEACKIAMPSVQNIKSPYDDDEKEPEPAPAPAAPAPTPKKRRGEAPIKPQRGSRREEYREEAYEEDSYDTEEPYDTPARQPQRRPPQKGNRQNYDQRSQAQRRPARQEPRRNSRQDYYEEDYRRDYDRYEDDYEDDYDDYERPRKHGAGFWICLVINIILVLLLIWFLVGLLMNLSVIPDTLHETLGFKWFNETIYPLF